jgi:Zn-dependent metalloprotease
MTNRSLQDVVVSRSTPAIPDSAAEMAVRAVLRHHAEWFRLRPGVDELVVVESRAAEWLRYLKLQQFYRGVPVVGASYEARVFPGGRVASIEGRFQPDIELIMTPAVNEQLAESRARALIVNGALPPEVPILRFDVERTLKGNRALVVVQRERGLVLAWSVVVENGPTERARVYIDADAGDVIGLQPIAGTWAR